MESAFVGAIVWNKCSGLLFPYSFVDSISTSVIVPAAFGGILPI